MVERLGSLDTILPILLGWLLGVLTPAIAERIRRPYRRRDLMRAVVDEMLGLQHTMAWVVYKARSRQGTLSDALLDRILPIVESDNGPDRNEGIIMAIKELRKEPEEERNVRYLATRNPNAGFGIKKYDLPLFSTQVSDLAICGSDFQRRVLYIRHQLDLYNQIATNAQSLFEKTFDNLSENNRKIVIANLEEAYRDTGNRAEAIIEKIYDLEKRYGDRRD